MNLKYAHVEREKWLLAAVPGGLEVETALRITDRYLTGTRLRLRSRDDVLAALRSRGCGGGSARG